MDHLEPSLVICFNLCQSRPSYHFGHFQIFHATHVQIGPSLWFWQFFLPIWLFWAMVANFFHVGSYFAVMVILSNFWSSWPFWWCDVYVLVADNNGGQLGCSRVDKKSKSGPLPFSKGSLFNRRPGQRLMEGSGGVWLRKSLISRSHGAASILEICTVIRTWGASASPPTSYLHIQSF